MYLGRFQLGDWVDVWVRTTNASGVCTQPHTTGDQAPVAHVYKGATHIESLRLPLFHTDLTGLFYCRIQLDSSYAAGNYMVIVTWSVASKTFFGSAGANFSVVGGGSASGHVVALEELDRPEAVYIVGEYDTGVVFQGRNPS